MDKVNYIVHLNTVLERFNDDDRIRQGHIALYMALFQKWNRSFFKNMFMINRNEIMDMAKFRSKTTYHNHIRDLHKWGFLEYYPSFSPRKGSRINMSKYGTSIEQALYPTLPESGQQCSETRPKIGTFFKTKNKEKLYKLTKPKNEQAVINFFNKNGWPEIEGIKFHAFLKSKNYQIENGSKIEDWKIVALKFSKNDFQKI